MLIECTVTGTLWVDSGHNGITAIENVDLNMISHECPVLAAAFEHGPDKKYSATIPAPCPRTVERFLYFLEHGTYRFDNEDVDVNNLFLLVHLQMAYMGINFDVSDLYWTAKCSISQATELAVSLPHPFVDLCEAVKFAYDYLRDEMGILEVSGSNLCLSYTN
jgi:hypothetical protein